MLNVEQQMEQQCVDRKITINRPIYEKRLNSLGIIGHEHFKANSGWLTNLIKLTKTINFNINFIKMITCK